MSLAIVSEWRHKARAVAGHRTRVSEDSDPQVQRDAGRSSSKWTRTSEGLIRKTVYYYSPRLLAYEGRDPEPPFHAGLFPGLQRSRHLELARGSSSVKLKYDALA